MIWIEVLIALFLIGSAIIGYKRGMVRMLLSFTSFLLTIAVIWFAQPYVKDWVQGNTKIEQKLSDRLEKVIEKQLKKGYTSITEHKEEDEAGDWTPEGWALLQTLIDRMNQEELEKLPQALNGPAAVQAVSRRLADRLADTILSLGVYLALYVVVRLLVFAIGHVLITVAKLPLIKEANSVAGSMVALIEAVLLVEMLFLIVRLASDANAGGAWIAEQFSKDPVLTWLYTNNLFLYLFGEHGNA